MKGKTEVAKEVAKKHGSRDLIVILGGGGVVKNQEVPIVHNKTAEAFSEELMNSLRSVASKREIKNPFKLEGGCQLSSRYAGSLISGKEAFNAVLDGKEVEWSESVEGWHLFTEDMAFAPSELASYKFRYKKKIISINGIEVPAPFEPKEGDVYWHVFPNRECGYGFNDFESLDVDFYWMQFGAWRTEPEIKQVVEALRSVLGGKQ